MYAKTHRHTPSRVGEQFSQAACHDAKNQSNPFKIHLLTLSVSSFLWGCYSLHALHVPAVRHGLSFFEFIIVRVCGLVHVYPDGPTHTYTHIYIIIYIYIHINIHAYTYTFHIFAYVSFTNLCLYWLAMTKQQAQGATPSCFLSRLLLFLLCQRRLDLDTAGHAWARTHAMSVRIDAG